MGRGGKGNKALCCKSHSDSLERVNVTVVEICLAEVDAWKNCLTGWQGV